MLLGRCRVGTLDSLQPPLWRLPLLDHKLPLCQAVGQRPGDALGRQGAGSAHVAAADWDWARSYAAEGR